MGKSVGQWMEQETGRARGGARNGTKHGAKDGAREDEQLSPVLTAFFLFMPSCFAGVVCRGKYQHVPVAMKMFLTAAQIEHLTGKTDTSRRPSEADDDVIASGEALFMFRDLRNEVTLLAQLDHPYIVALLGG